VGELDRPLRDRPEGGAFVIENGAEFFNRPLYGGNTGFRVDAGDRPEFSLYLPGRGGNLRLGVKTAAGATWLHAAASITARYVPGAMRYTVRDAGDVVVEIAARPVRNVAELLSQVAALQPGVASPVKILRGKKTLSLTVRPGVRPMNRQR
jgi:hypothetical protein